MEAAPDVIFRLEGWEGVGGYRQLLDNARRRLLNERYQTLVNCRARVLHPREASSLRRVEL